MAVKHPKIGIARFAHKFDIHDCRVGFVRVGYYDWNTNGKTKSVKKQNNFKPRQ